MFNVFGWIRRRVAQAILEGTQDALEALDAPPDSMTAAPLSLPDALRSRLVPALPAGNGGTASSEPGKPAVPDAPTNESPEPVAAAGNGRRKRA
jgi:hypothetical protein